MGLDQKEFTKAFIKAMNDPSVSQALTGRVSAAVMDEMNGLRQAVQQLTSTVSQLTEKLTEKEEENTRLKEKVTTLEQTLEEKCDSLEQYTRRNTLRISGLEENDNEDAYEVSMDVLKKLPVGDQLSFKDIDRCHRIGPKTTTDRPRLMMVKFATYRMRQKVYKQKRNLNDTSIFINEDLTKRRATLLYEARKMKRAGGIKDCWSADGNIFVRNSHGRVQMVRNLSQLDSVNQQLAAAASASEERDEVDANSTHE
jgi:exosome complex exonuclease DIS3/RRP44